MAGVLEDLHLVIVVVGFEVVERWLNVPHWGDSVILSDYNQPLN